MERPGLSHGVQLVRFATVGVGAALILFVFSFLFRGLGMPPFIASTTAYAIAFAVAYSAQRGWTFGGAHDHAQAFPRYLAAQLACGLMSGLVAHIAVETLHQSAFRMSVAATIAAGMTSYVLSSLWVFPSRSRTR